MKQQQAARAREPESIGVLLDLPFVGVAVFDVQSRKWTRFNDRLGELLGYARDELARLSWRDICDSRDHSESDAAFRRVLSRRAKHVRTVLRLKRKDGSLLEADIDLSVMRPRAGARGQLVALVAEVHDLAERDRLETARQDAEEKLQAVIEQSITGIYIIENGRFTYVNPRMAAIFGYATAELECLPVLELVAGPDRDRVLENIRKRMDGETRSVQYEFQGLRKDGAVIEVGVHGNAAVIQGRRVIVGVVQDITERRKSRKRIDEYVRKLETAMLATVDSISHMVDLRDPYTAGHERRVAHISSAVARELGLEAERVRGLEIAGRLHDIGKISVPAEILSKPTRLTGAEYEIVKLHAGHGLGILKVIEFPWPVAEIAHQHHERLDGSGYPRGLKNGEIIEEARILAVADVIEAMASHRPYRASLGIEPALAEIERGSGKQYDADVVAGALRLFRERRYEIPA
jgi:PAS domain S-box-containing protein